MVHFGSIWSTSVLFRLFSPFWSYSIYSVHFDFLLSILVLLNLMWSTSVLCGPICSYLVHYIYFGLNLSIHSYLVHFSPLRSYSVHIGPLYLFGLCRSNSVLLVPIWFTSIRSNLVNLCLLGSILLYFGLFLCTYKGKTSLG